LNDRRQPVEEESGRRREKRPSSQCRSVQSVARSITIYRSSKRSYRYSRRERMELTEVEETEGTESTEKFKQRRYRVVRQE
jgi:hypothetical protein